MRQKGIVFWIKKTIMDKRLNRQVAQAIEHERKGSDNEALNVLDSILASFETEWRNTSSEKYFEIKCYRD